MAGTSNSITTHNVLSGVLNADNVISGLVNTAFNPAYALVTQAGAQIVLFINNNDYKMYAQLKDKSGNLIYTSNIIDLPLETMVVAGRYDSNTKKLILVLDNGNEIEIPLGALISGLVNEDDLEANYYDKNEIDTLLEGYWTKIEITQEDIDNWNAKQEYLNQGDGIEISAETTLKGNTSQESTTGKNLFDISKVVSNWNSSTNICVRNNNDGTLTVSTPSTSSSVQALVPNKLSDYCPSLQVGDKVYITATTTGTQKYVYLTTSASVWSFGALRTISQNDLDSSVLWYSSGVSATATISDIMISTSGGDYEPYTGGNPAPNPDYPYPVNVVTGDNEVKVEGKNLLSQNNSTFNIFKELTIEPINAGTYTFSGNVVSSDTDASVCLVTFRNLTTEVKAITVTRDNFSTTLNLSEKVTSIRLYASTDYSKSTGDTATFSNLMISTSGGNYIPYQSQTYPINLGSMELCKIGDYQDVIKRSSGKNLFDEVFRQGSDNSIANTQNIFSQNNLLLEAGTYTFSCDLPLTSFKYAIGTNSTVFPASATFIDGFHTTSSFTFTLSEAKYVGIMVNKNNNTMTPSDVANYHFMLVKGTDTNYEPYGKVWYKYSAIRKVELNISDMNNSDDYPGWREVPYLNEDYPGLNIAIFPTTRLISNIGDSVNSFGVVTINTNSILILNKAFWNLTQTQWKTNYPNLIFVLYYAISTPTITPITDTTLIEQLDNLSIGLSNKWIKNISQTNAEIPFELEYDNTNLTISANLTDYYTKTETNTLLNEKVGFTDYGTTDTGGVIRDGTTSSGYGIMQTGINAGKLQARILSYTQYQNNLYTNGFIGKGTLENVLNARIGDIQTLLDNLNNGGGVE